MRLIFFLYPVIPRQCAFYNDEVEREFSNKAVQEIIMRLFYLMCLAKCSLRVKTILHSPYPVH